MKTSKLLAVVAAMTEEEAGEVDITDLVVAAATATGEGQIQDPAIRFVCARFCMFLW